MARHPVFQYVAGVTLLGLALVGAACSRCQAQDSSHSSRHDSAKVAVAVSDPDPPTASNLGAASTTPRRALDHNFKVPDKTWVMPKKLKEISGITPISKHELACIQDESGVVFVYDLDDGRITREFRFAAGGDYEDVAVVGSTLYVLRSDGHLFQMELPFDRDSLKKYELGLPLGEYESLAFDAEQERLLLAPKKLEAPFRGNHHFRPIFSWELASRHVSSEPALTLDLHDIAAFVAPEGAGKKSKKHHLQAFAHFSPTAIAIHPVTHEYVILSAIDHRIISCDREGHITGHADLDTTLFRQPEGLAFLANGDLLISNEAAGMRATILLFKDRH